MCTNNEIFALHYLTTHSKFFFSLYSIILSIAISISKSVKHLMEVVDGTSVLDVSHILCKSWRLSFCIVWLACPSLVVISLYIELP